MSATNALLNTEIFHAFKYWKRCHQKRWQLFSGALLAVELKFYHEIDAIVNIYGIQIARIVDNK